MPPLLHTQAQRSKYVPQISTVWLVAIFIVSLFVVFEVNTHQRLHQALEADAQKHKAETTSTHQASSGTTNEATSGASQRSAISLLTGASSQAQCHVEKNNEYHGAVLVWGDKNLKETEGECCEQCKQTSGCTAWVYCPDPKGCGPAGGRRPHQECWIKQAKLDFLFEEAMGKGHPGISWTSGAVYSEKEYQHYQQVLDEKKKAEEERKLKLRDDPELPLVYLDVAIDGNQVGRIEMVLFMRESPLAAENMRQLCSGEKGPAFHLKGATFYRIIDRFIDQTGLQQGTSIYGGMFKDDEGGLRLKHSRPYLLSAANGGPGTNTGHFSITVAPAHHLDGHYTIFGECVSGFDVIDKVNQLSRGQPNNELLQSHRAVITDAGQLRRGSLRVPPGLQP
eukprot:CAMPEP_0202891464 /NCGR_PEP_ID=MMETSP1392-20130828/1511_1 /ASSEMBLY_ACC=CAM_ASM_000868 /TAXON_ID=225041 /ORGANISM="Chlamydomonas chlamydogama, Strain SAG 11-48b" /LENGTH=393 /DNA_ID=CAMNT_0049575217 /DNA_START=101 /DNA_END=1282 /DNA_ORIENTATION=+